MEFTRADELRIRDSVAMVQHGTTVGTAFFVAPGQLLTCEHVVRGAPTGALKIVWSGGELIVEQVITADVNSGLDVAVLNVGIREHPFLEIGAAETAIAPVYAYGFPFRERGYFGYPSFGTLAGTAREGNVTTGRELLHVVDATFSPGLSGAPLFSLKDWRVVAIVRRNRPEGGGYAIPIEQVAELSPDLLSVSVRKAARGVKYRDALSSYFQAIATEHEHVALMDAQRTLKLDEVFVSVTLTRGGISGSKLGLVTGGRVSIISRQGAGLRTARRDRGSPQRFAVEQSIGLFDLLSFGKVIIIGEPGCGKTTLLRHFVRKVCKGDFARERIPIYVRLVDLEVDVGCIERWIRTTRASVASRLLEVLENGSCILLLDGFDEASRTSQPALAREIERLAALGNQVILSCRSVSLPKGLFSSDFRIFECIGFSAHQMRRFLRQWFAESPERAILLEQQIDKHAGVTGFARNPLLLSLMAVIAENETDFKLPVHRTELYEKAIRVLLERRSESARSDLSTRRKLGILRQIAHSNFRMDREVFSEDELIEELEKISQEEEAFVAEQLLTDFVESDGILAVQALGRYRFLHLTFQEYLTAQSVVREPDAWESLKNVVDEPRWEEVIRLTCGLLPRELGTALINKILATSPPTRRARRLLLAARASSDAPEVTTELTARVSTLLVETIGRGQRSGRLTEFEDALAFVARTHVFVMENIIAPAASTTNGETPLLSFQCFVRLLGFVADKFSIRTLDNLWERFSSEEIAEADDLEIRGSLLEAIAQAGMGHFVPVACEALASRSSYLAAMSARALIELRREACIEPLLFRFKQATGQERLLALAVLCSFDDQHLLGRLFTEIFSGEDFELMKVFAFHFNRNEAPLSTELVREAIAASDNGSRLAHIYSMYRCFLDPVLFSNLRATALSASSRTDVRCVGISSLLRLDTESLSELLLSATKELALGRSDCFRAVLAGTPPSAAEELGRMIMAKLTEEQRLSQAPALLRFCFANRVTTLENWLEQLVANQSQPAAHRRRAMLALAYLGSQTFLQHAGSIVVGQGRASTEDLILMYRALGLLPGEKAEELLTRGIENESAPAIVTEIVHALGQQPSANATALLIKLLDPSNWPSHWPPPEGPQRRGDQRPSDRRRLSVLFSLEQQMDVSAVPYLEAISNDEAEDTSTREIALNSARNISLGA